MVVSAQVDDGRQYLGWLCADTQARARCPSQRGSPYCWLIPSPCLPAAITYSRLNLQPMCDHHDHSPSGLWSCCALLHLPEHAV